MIRMINKNKDLENLYHTSLILRYKIWVIVNSWSQTESSAEESGGILIEYAKEVIEC